MSWITINIGQMRIGPRSIIKVLLWMSVIGLAGVAAGAAPQESASAFYEIGLLSIFVWLAYDYLIPLLWTLYQFRNGENQQTGTQ